VSGNADEAIALVRESLTWIRDLQDKYAFAYALVPLVAAAVLKGDDEWAARILGARDAVSERTGAQVLLKLVHDLQVESERRFVHALARIVGRLRTPPGAGRRIGLRRLFQIQSRVADVAKPAAYVLLQASLKQPADGRRRFEWQVPGIVPPLVIVGSCCSSREGRTRSRTNACPPVR